MLKMTLDSLLAQEINGSFDYEIILADNNSKDNTADTVKNYLGKFGGRLRYLFEPRQGKPYALNSSVEEARGEIIAFTDDDVIVDKKWLKNINNVFKGKNDLDLLGGKVIPFFTAKIPAWMANYRSNILRYPLMHYDLGDAYLECNSKNKILPIGGNISLRKKSYFKYGGFSENEKSEDIELGNKWHNSGAKIAYSPDVVVYHYANPSRMNKSYFRKYFYQTGTDHSSIYKEKYSRGRKLSGIPLWVFKDLLLTIGKYCKSVLNFDRDMFLNELEMWHKLGIVCGLKQVKIEVDHRKL